MFSNRQVREWLDASSSSSSDEEEHDSTVNVAVAELNRLRRKYLEMDDYSSSDSLGWPDSDESDIESDDETAPKPYVSRHTH